MQDVFSPSLPLELRCRVIFVFLDIFNAVCRVIHYLPFVFIKKSEIEHIFDVSSKNTPIAVFVWRMHSNDKKLFCIVFA